MAARETRPENYAQRILDRLKGAVPAAEKKLFDAFVNHLLANLEDPKGFIAALCCQEKDLVDWYRHFASPLPQEREEVKVRVIVPKKPKATAGNDPNVCFQDGVNILVHLKDTPFVFDTLRNYLKQSRLQVFAQTHTTFQVSRNAKEKITALNGDAASGERESIMVLITEPVEGAQALKKLKEDLNSVLISVKRSVDDFEAMRELIGKETAALAKKGLAAESRFLEWMYNDNFVFMGARTVTVDGKKLLPDESRPILGTFRGDNARKLMDRITPGMMKEVEQILLAIAAEPSHDPLIIEYCHHGQSIIYASEGIDFVAVDRSAKTARKREILLILGRFSRIALATRSSSVPMLQERLTEVLDQAGAPPGSYLHQEFRSLYGRMPLRELLYSQSDVIGGQIAEILKIQGETDVKVMSRLGRHGNYVSIVTALNRNRYRANLHKELAALFSKRLRDPVTSVETIEVGSMFLVVCYANHEPGKPMAFNRERIESQVKNLILTWEDKLKKALGEALPPTEANRTFNRFNGAFDAIYKGAVGPAEALADIETLETLDAKRSFASRVYAKPTGETFIKLYTLEEIDLTSIVSTFTNFGVVCLHELSTAVRHPALKDPVRIQRFEVAGTPVEKSRLADRAKLFCAALEAIQKGRLRDDPLNKLALLEGFSPKEVTLLRALRQYLVQIIPHLAVSTVTRILTGRHDITRLILHAFLTRFTPGLKGRAKQMEGLVADFEEALTDVASLKDDQVLRGIHNVVMSCLRTNYFQGDDRPSLSFKIDAAKIIDMPEPRPWRGVFVHGPFLEGVHLRGGQVARGGLRHSDRFEDFRTEILGLMKTQQVKNGIIVPVGAKGGFVVHGMEKQKDAKRKKAHAVTQYKNFIRGLLDITDNRVAGEIKKPVKTHAYDGDDPYFVVAADKGTATFSDLANQVAMEEYGFWMGDAFASGGSNGYDHKKVGITARGAWECCNLHFSEQGRDIFTEPFTVVAIGDMGGDVFGNGLLRTRCAKLVGAFNHIHIFLDPNPDPDKSFDERERLFKLPRSAWTDYNAKLISKGGGVFDRSAKSIPLNAELRKLLDTDDKTLSGEEVIRRLLTARVDLLYNGGIGTYVKASSETHLDVSDKANDPVRVDAPRVRANIVVEGGNLGLTQKARLEYAVAGGPEGQGGRINTDAIDNSGGVDLSDFEVNLKILFDHLLELGEIKDRDARNDLLEKLTDEVAEMALTDNRLQHMALSRDEVLSLDAPEFYLEGLEMLQEEAGLDFEGEDVPDMETLKIWFESDSPAPRPLLAIMLGYAKIWFYKTLLESDVVDLFFCERYLEAYFPDSVVREYGAHLADHVLKREIIANAITNRVINQTGVGLLLSTLRKAGKGRRGTGPRINALVKAYLIVETLLDADRYRQRVLDLPHASLAVRKYAMLQEMEEVLLHLALWMVQNLDEERITTDVINLYAKAIAAFHQELWDALPILLSPDRIGVLRKKRQEIVDQGIPEDLATDTVLLPYLKDAMDILHIKEALHTRFELVGRLYIQVDDYFGISWIQESLEGAKAKHRDEWGRRTLANVTRELQTARTQLVTTIISFKRHQESEADAFKNYVKEMDAENRAYQELLGDLRNENLKELLPLLVLVRQINELVR